MIKSDCQKIISPHTTRYHGLTYDIIYRVNHYHSDLLGIFVHSFTDCIDACSNYRANAVHLNATCGAVTYTPDLDQVKYEGNCYLKNGHANIVPVADPGAASAKVHSGSARGAGISEHLSLTSGQRAGVALHSQHRLDNIHRGTMSDLTSRAS